MCSFGDVAAVSDVVDLSLARVLKSEASDLIIAPGFEPAALEMLRAKKKGGYLIFQIDPDYEPPEIETREVLASVFNRNGIRPKCRRLCLRILSRARRPSLPT